MPLTRITSTLGAVALGALLVASNNTAGAAGSPDRPQPPSHVRTVDGHFVAPAPHAFRPHSNMRMGLHCDSADMSM
jgi:hypothetical protein